MPFGMSFHFFTLDFIIFFVVSKWGNDYFRPIKRESKQEGDKINKRIFMSTWHNEVYLKKNSLISYKDKHEAKEQQNKEI
jgi:hypothetical protein